MAGFSLSAKSDLSARAEKLASEYPPGVVLENLFLGFFTLIGMILGALWFLGSKYVFLIGLAFMDGYRRGAQVKKAAPRPSAAANGHAPSPPAEPSRPFVGDPRTIDAYQTPFGIPFGPNVQASHE